MTVCNHLTRSHRFARTGAVAPLMAFLFPVMLLICGVCLNFAWMELNRTELRVATDAAARAAGRAFSEFQDVDTAIDYAITTGAMNNIGSNPLRIDSREEAAEVVFGHAARTENGYGRYDFDEKDRGAVRNRTERANAVRVFGKRTEDSLGGTIRMVFAGWGPFDRFSPAVSTTSTQVDRDIALVLDRSGSMLEYKDFPMLDKETRRLRNEKRINNAQRDAALTSNIWARSYPYYYYDSSARQYYNAYFYYFYYDQSYDPDLWEYCFDYETRKGSGSTPAYNTNSAAPRHSRWDQLEEAVEAFIDVLERTDQEERVSLVTFNSSASLVESITSDYPDIVDKVVGIAPKNGTNIQDGMQIGANSILDEATYPNARFYAAKTIIIMSDGEQTVGSMTPSQKAAQIVGQNNVVIHAVTFSTNISANAWAEMDEVARIGGGKHYHADTGEQLVAIFREIANSLPTIITE